MTRRKKEIVRDTAETMLAVQDYTPPRRMRVHLESLPEQQRFREVAYRAGKDAHARGDERESSHWHAEPRRGRTVSTWTCIAAFELGWDTAERAAWRADG